VVCRGASAGIGMHYGVGVGGLMVEVRQEPIIATFATWGAGAGMTLVLPRGVQIAGGPREVVALSSTRVLEVLTVPLVVVLVILAVAWVALEQTRFGRWTYAIGSNRFAARGAGILVDRHLM